MVIRVLGVVVVVGALAGAARAETRVVDCDPGCIVGRPYMRQWSRLGTRIAFGALPIDDARPTTASLGVSLDRPLAGGWRVLVEYEYLWLGDGAGFRDHGVAALADSGHRAHLGVRRQLFERTWAGDRVGVSLDGEAGGGVLLVDRASGALALPHGFAGVRANLALECRRRVWEYELVARGLAVPDGVGVLFGIGLVWGE